MDDPSQNWMQAVTASELKEQPVVVQRAGRQIAVVRVGERVFAVDNRCPHEGYPLAKGTVDGNCVLTCNWHNWKFRLPDGECVLGGDDVRVYPVKEEGGIVWIDLADPPREVTERRILKGLRTAFERREFDRICREVTRLKLSGIDPLIAVSKAIAWSFDRLEFGFTHAYAAAADWLAEARRYDGDWERQLICLSETIDHMADDALRHPGYPFADPVDDFAPDLLLEAIEHEQRQRAEGLVARAFEAGRHWEDLEETFVRAALAHYNDFGHSLIYVYKARQLVAMLGNAERELALALTRSLCYSTREDLIPEFSDYAPALTRLKSKREKTANGGNGSTVLSCPFPASTQGALQWVEDSLPASETAVVYDRLLEALSWNLLHYDTSYGSAWDRPVSQNVGWLNFTHGITFANAVRVCCTSYPECWPDGLLQLACFVGRNHSFLDDQVRLADWAVTDEPAFFARVREQMLDHGFRDPIFSAHLVKTPVAVEEELAFASEDCRRVLLAALNRFLSSPIKQKHVRRLARQAISLVAKDYGSP